VSGTDLCVA